MSRFDDLLGRVFGVSKAEQAERAWKNALWTTIVIGAVFLALWSVGQSSPLAVFSGGAIVAAAAAMVGALAGMIFGLPRSAPKAASGSVDQQPGGQPSADSTAGSQSTVFPNSNMIEISDWLTKIVVGLGLTQLGSIPGDFQRLVDYVRPALGDSQGATALAGALIVAYGLAGFVMTYLYSRTDLEVAVAAADSSLTGQLALLSKMGDLQRSKVVTTEEVDRVKAQVLSNVSKTIS